MNPARLTRLPQNLVPRRPLTRASARKAPNAEHTPNPEHTIDLYGSILEREASKVSGKDMGLRSLRGKLRSKGFKAPHMSLQKLLSADRPLVKAHPRIQPYHRPHGVRWIEQMEEENLGQIATIQFLAREIDHRLPQQALFSGARSLLAERLEEVGRWPSFLCDGFETQLKRVNALLVVYYDLAQHTGEDTRSSLASEIYDWLSDATWVDYSIHARADAQGKIKNYLWQAEVLTEQQPRV